MLKKGTTVIVNDEGTKYEGTITGVKQEDVDDSGMMTRYRVDCPTHPMQVRGRKKKGQSFRGHWYGPALVQAG